jgi:hypothetical protein
MKTCHAKFCEAPAADGWFIHTTDGTKPACVSHGCSASWKCQHCRDLIEAADRHLELQLQTIK